MCLARSVMERHFNDKFARIIQTGSVKTIFL